MTDVLNVAFSEADYQADAALVKRYAGVELSQLTFASYASQFTLSSVLGTSKQLEQDHHGYGTPRGVGNGEILARILRQLESAGVLLPSGPKTPLGDKIASALAAGVSADQWINFPASYMLDVPAEGRMRKTAMWLAGVEERSVK